MSVHGDDFHQLVGIGQAVHGLHLVQRCQIPTYWDADASGEVCVVPEPEGLMICDRREVKPSPPCKKSRQTAMASQRKR